MERSGETARDSRDPVRISNACAHDHLFVLLEGDRPLAGAARSILTDVDEVVIGRGETRSIRRERTQGVARICLTLPDRFASTTHARILRNARGWVIEDMHSTNGVVVDGHRVTRTE